MQKDYLGYTKTRVRNIRCLKTDVITQKETRTMNNCPHCQSRNTLEHTRLDDNRSYQWVPAIHCLKCGWYGYPRATQREMETGRVQL